MCAPLLLCDVILLKLLLTSCDEHTTKGHLGRAVIRLGNLLHGQNFAHPCIGNGKGGLVQGLLKHQVSAEVQLLFCIYGQLLELLHQPVKFLRRQLVENGANTFAQRLQLFCGQNRVIRAFLLTNSFVLCSRCPGVLSLVEFHRLPGY